MKDKRDIHSQLRRELRDAAEAYWAVITASGWSLDAIDDRRRNLASLALRLHIFEQGRRSKR
jgi:hypothetical protein